MGKFKDIQKAYVVVLALFVLAAFSAWAAPLRNVPMHLRQPDKSILNCFASGDEYFHFLHDSAGYTIVLNPNTGYYVYAEEKNGLLVPTDFIAGKTNPRKAGLKPHAAISQQEYSCRRQAWEIPANRMPKKSAAKSVGLNVGTLNNIVIMVRFLDDTEMETSFDSVNRMFNDHGAGSNSMYNYFLRDSYGKLNVCSHIYPAPVGDSIVCVVDSFPRGYYSQWSASNVMGYTNDWQRADREMNLWKRTLDYVNAHHMIDSTLDVDLDNDGFVDNVVFVVKGTYDSWNELLWPHAWDLYAYDCYINGKQVMRFNVQLETSGPSYFSVSCFCHEMTHTLGAPDLYHYYNGTNISPVGGWDLMEGNGLNWPQHTGSHIKHRYLNFIDSIPELKASGAYALHSLGGDSNHNVCWKIPSRRNGQCYLLEYRRKSDPFENTLPGTGLLVYRINAAYGGNALFNGTDVFDEVFLFRPNSNDDVTNGDLNNAYFSDMAGRTSLGPSTNPHPYFTKGTADTAFSLTNIALHGDSLTFVYNMLLDSFPVVLSCNDATLGGTEGDGVYAQGSMPMLNAVPNSESRFVEWSDGETENPRYALTNDTVRLSAVFEPLAEGNVTMRLYSLNPNLGTASIDNASGTLEHYPAGTTITLRATPVDSTKRFRCWNDGVARNPRQVTLYSDTTFVALFDTLPALHWKDVVTSRPAGYRVDINGDVTIDNAEGLAWLASVVNGWNGQNADDFHGKTVRLSDDIDIGAHLWSPIGMANMAASSYPGCFRGTFDGMGHIIRGINLNEASMDNAGLFYFVWYGTICNVGLTDGSVHGAAGTAPLVGSLAFGAMRNCFANVEVKGTSNVGGLVGYMQNALLENSYSLCRMSGHSCGGLVGRSHYDEYSGVHITTVANCYFAGSFSDADSSDAICYSTIWLMQDNCNAPTDVSVAGWLMETLNGWVKTHYDANYRLWLPDTRHENNGWPRMTANIGSPCDILVTRVVSVGATKATVAWNNMSLPDSCQLEYGPVGFAHGQGTRLMVARDEFTITGLSPSTTYGVYVRPNCYVGTTKGWSALATFTTACGEGVDSVRNCFPYYQWGNGKVYASNTTTPIMHTTSMAGCDSATSLHLYLGYGAADTNSFVLDVCGGYVWNDSLFTSSVNFRLDTFGVDGCDSLITMDLTVRQNWTQNDTMTACGALLWEGTTYHSDTTLALRRDTAQDGCDSSHFLRLKVYAEKDLYDTLTLCDANSFDGIPVAHDTLFVYNGITSQGCDSIFNLLLQPRFDSHSEEFHHCCDTFSWHGTLYSESTDQANYTTQNASGCDSIVTLHLQVHHNDVFTDSVEACDGYSLGGVTYTHSTQLILYDDTSHWGCDSLSVVALTINYSSNDTIRNHACDAYTWNGNRYLRDTVVTNVALSSKNCDSIVTLQLKVDTSYHVAVSDTACDSYTWEGITTTVDNTLQHAYTAENGCDSVVTMRLFINHSVVKERYDTICSGQTYSYYGFVADSTADYVHHGIGAEGCDSTFVLHLQVNPVNDIRLSLALKEGDVVDFYGFHITEAGTYSETYTNQYGCDSIVTIEVTYSDLAIEGGKNAMSFKAYPNPTQGPMTVLADGQDSPMTAVLYDMAGHMMVSETGHTPSLKMDLSNMPAGMYLLKVITLQGETLLKIIIA